MDFHSRSIEALKPRERVARNYQWNSHPTHAAEIEAILIILFASPNSCLFRREADARLKDEHILLDPFDDHTAVVHRSQSSVSQNSSWELEAIDTVLCSRHTREFSQLSVMNKYGKEPNSRKVREVHLSLPPSYLHHRWKAVWERKADTIQIRKKYKSWISWQNSGNLIWLNHLGKKKLSLR